MSTKNNGRDDLLETYESMTKAELIGALLAAAEVAHEAEELIEELREEQAELDAAASGHPESSAQYDALLHGAVAA